MYHWKKKKWFLLFNFTYSRIYLKFILFIKLPESVNNTTADFVCNIYERTKLDKNAVKKLLPSINCNCLVKVTSGIKLLNLNKTFIFISSCFKITAKFIMDYLNGRQNIKLGKKVLSTGHYCIWFSHSSRDYYLSWMCPPFPPLNLVLTRVPYPLVSHCWILQKLWMFPVIETTAAVLVLLSVMADDLVTLVAALTILISLAILCFIAAALVFGMWVLKNVNIYTWIFVLFFCTSKENLFSLKKYSNDNN